MDTFYVGLDLSFTCTGVVVLGPDGGLVDREHIKAPPAKVAQPKRLGAMQREILGAIFGDQPLSPRGKHEPVEVCVEGYSMGSRATQAHKAGELGGVMRLSLWRHFFGYVNVPPSTLKKFATGKGNADKSLVLREVWRKWGYEAVNDNDADAFALARMAWQLDQPRETWTKTFAALAKKVEVVR